MNTAEEEKKVCPHCYSDNVVILSLFGDRLLSSKFRCEDCSNCFEAVRF
ncbi:PaaD-like zinc ribbon domain-containing protein [Bacillus sp. M6-12]